MEQLAPPVASRDLSRLSYLWQAVSPAVGESCRREFCDLAAEEGRIDLLQWLKGQGYLFSGSYSACDAAAEQHSSKSCSGSEANIRTVHGRLHMHSSSSI